jgi:hypothetical protein
MTEPLLPRRARSPLVQVFAARAGRVAFGVVLLAGAVAVLAALDEPYDASPRLLVTVPFALLLGAVVQCAALWLGPWLSTRQRALGGGPSVPVAGLSSPPEAGLLHAVAGRLEGPSYSLPLVGLALVAPLSLHAPLFLLAPDEGMSSLHSWITASVFLVGLAHLTLAVMSYRFARRLHRGLVLAADRESLLALCVTIAAGCVPGVFFAGIPPILVAITGLLFVPASFLAMERRQRRERGLLSASP